MAKGFELIIPPAYETATTGLIIAGEKRAYDKLWRVEVINNGQAIRPMITANGNEVAGHKIPRAINLIADKLLNMAAQFIQRA